MVSKLLSFISTKTPEMALPVFPVIWPYNSNLSHCPSKLYAIITVLLFFGFAACVGVERTCTRSMIAHDTICCKRISSAYVSSRPLQDLFWGYSPGLAFKSATSLLCKFGTEHLYAKLSRFIKSEITGLWDSVVGSGHALARSPSFHLAPNFTSNYLTQSTTCISPF